MNLGISNNYQSRPNFGWIPIVGDSQSVKKEAYKISKRWLSDTIERTKIKCVNKLSGEPIFSEEKNRSAWLIVG